MLRALLSRKSRTQILSPAGGSAGEATEDMLTASVFSRLAYLDQCALAVIFEALEPNAFREIGTLREVRFWPSFELDGGRVEPDVILEFERLIVWVEAKRWDGTSLQSKDQLFRQWRAMNAHVPPDRKHCQLAMGGHARWSERRELRLEQRRIAASTLATEQKQLIFACAWEDLAWAVDEIESEVRSTRRLLDDIGAALRCHSVYPSPALEMASLMPVHVSTSFPDDWDFGDCNDDWQPLQAEHLSCSAVPELR